MTQAAVVQGDHACIRCGYNLRGAPEAGVCPECGSSVADSLRGNLLAFADPAFLRTLVRGSRMVWWSVALMLLSIVMSIAAGAVAASLAPGTMWVFYLLPAIMLVASVLALLGWWLVSTPDPAESEQAGAVSRRVLRIAVAVGAGCLLINTALAMSSAAPPIGTAGGPSVRASLGMLSAFVTAGAYVAFAVQFFASMLYVRVLAPRIPDPGLDARAKFAMWCAAICLLVTLAAIPVTFIGRQQGGGAGAGFMTVMCGAGVLMLGFFVVYVLVIDRLKSSLVKVQTGAPLA